MAPDTTGNGLLQTIGPLAERIGGIVPLGNRLWEIHKRFTFGPGYRVYFAEDGDTVVVVLGGGDKSSQNRDIEKAKTCWKEYQSHG